MAIRSELNRSCKSKKKHCWISVIAVWMLIVSLSFIPLVSASHPSSADSDNDGIPDGWESKHRLNPDDPGDAKRDYNHDGLTTLEEYKRGFDPFNRDTDGDKLSNYGEVTGLFGFVTDPLNVDTDEDGLTDLEETAAYISVRNQTQKDELFVDAAIIEDLKKQYYPYNLCPTDPDVDNDGLLDGEEISRGTSPTNVDFDADGLTDFDEVYTYSTNPTNVDTDGDWLSDREELTGGSYGITTDPNCVDTDGDGIRDGEELLAVALVMVPPSTHALTYEAFIADNAYAGEYVTVKARVEKIAHESRQDMHSYSLRLKPLDLMGDIQNKRGIVRVNNSWHYDIEHDMVFIDDVFGYVLKEEDVVLVTGVAGTFVGMSREITVKTNEKDAEGCIYLLLEPQEASARSSIFNLASPAANYPFWSHVKSVSLSTSYSSGAYVNVTPGSTVSASNSTMNNSTGNSTRDESSIETRKLKADVAALKKEVAELKGQINAVSESGLLRASAVTPEPEREASATASDKPEKRGIVGLLLSIGIGIGIVIASLFLYNRLGIRSMTVRRKDKGGKPSSDVQSTGTRKEWS
jgi:hypothetical protein